MQKIVLSRKREISRFAIQAAEAEGKGYVRLAEYYELLARYFAAGWKREEAYRTAEGIVYQKGQS